MDLLDSLHARLVAAVAAAGEDAFPAGLTVADLYQHLIPYRVVRGPLGLAELAEYEHAMLRLLSGERHYVEVVDADVRIEIQRELASLNPILGIYRDYSSAAVRLLGAPGAAEEPAGAAPIPSAGEGAWREAAEGAAGAMAEVAQAPETREGPPDVGHQEVRDDEVRDEEARDQGPRRGTVEVEALPRPESPPSAAEACSGCGRALPPLPDVRFCPFCGRDQRPPTCSNCGAQMDPEWSFCTRCGTGRGTHAKTRSREG